MLSPWRDILQAACFDFPGSVVITDMDKLKEVLREELFATLYLLPSTAKRHDGTVSDDSAVHVNALFESQASFSHEMDSFAGFITPANFPILAEEAKSQVREFERSTTPRVQSRGVETSRET